MVTKLFTHPTAAWVIPLIIALMSVVLSGVSAYTHNDKELTARITALESHRVDDKDKLDHIQVQVDKLVEWALGKK